MSELTTLHDAITRIISERMPKVLHVEQFPELDADVQTPALLYGITDMTLGTDRGEGKTALIGRFQSCILIEADRPRASLQAAILASQLAVILKDQFWGGWILSLGRRSIFTRSQKPPRRVWSNL